MPPRVFRYPTMPKLSYIAALIALVCLCSGCLTTGSYETARVAPDDEVERTTGVGLTTLSGPYHDYALTTDDGEPVTHDTYESIPTAPIQGEYLFRWSRGMGYGFELDLAILTPVVQPFGFGAGVSLGLKHQFFGGQDGPLALAAAARIMGHGQALGGGPASMRFGTGQLHGRLIGSYHWDRAVAVLAPMVVAEGVVVNLETPDSTNYSGSSSGVLWGASAGPGWELNDQLLLFELTVLAGDDSGFPWASDNAFALLPGSDNHIRIMLGVGISGRVSQ